MPEELYLDKAADNGKNFDDFTETVVKKGGLFKLKFKSIDSNSILK